MPLLDLPHFGWSTLVNNCVIFLLSFLHGGALWIDQSYGIDADVIKIVTTLLCSSEDLATTLQACNASI